MNLFGAINDNNLLYAMNQIAHPVGSVFMTVNDDDPVELFGGKWEQMSDIGNIHVWKRTA